MMNEQTRQFVRDNAEKDVRALALSGKKYPEVDMPFALDQIAGRQTARQKLPTWAEHDDIIYPPHLSMEQCSSEQTARYKMELVGEYSFKECRSVGDRSVDNSQADRLSDSEANNLSTCQLVNLLTKTSNSSTETIVDLTGGFGVDFSFMSRGFDKGVYVEQQAHLCEIARDNFALLGMGNVEVVCADGVGFLRTMEPVTVIYLDPARRNEHGGKTYAISDCTPDVIEIKDLLLDKAKKVVVKLSPMLDWHKAVDDLDNCVSEVHIVSVDNECKELLLVMERNVVELKVVCVNIQNSKIDVFEFEETWQLKKGVQECGSVDNSGSSNLLTRQLVNSSTEATNSESPSLRGGFRWGPSSTFLYEPNASIMKTGCFEQLETAFGVKQLERNSHLFVSEYLIEDFPGRKFKIETVTSLNKKDIKKALSGIDKANISVRNFPMSVNELRKRLKIKEGGSDYIFATTLMDKSHVLLLCSRL